jgi:hypothetical protein
MDAPRKPNADQHCGPRMDARPFLVFALNAAGDNGRTPEAERGSTPRAANERKALSCLCLECGRVIGIVGICKADSQN